MSQNKRPSDSFNKLIDDCYKTNCYSYSKKHEKPVKSIKNSNKQRKKEIKTILKLHEIYYHRDFLLLDNQKFCTGDSEYDSRRNYSCRADGYGI